MLLPIRLLSIFPFLVFSCVSTKQTGFIVITVGYLLFVRVIGHTLATIMFLWMLDVTARSGSQNYDQAGSSSFHGLDRLHRFHFDVRNKAAKRARLKLR